jgi:hypothetical protein
MFTKVKYTVLAAILAIAIPLVAQQNQPNETGLPLYPGVTTGTQYPASQTKTGRYAIYTAHSRDSRDVVEAWYRRALPQAKETKDDNQLTHGFVLTNGKDRVLVYQLLQSAGAVIELQKYVGN